MGAIDAAAPEPVEVLIGRAGAAVARAVVDLLGGTYGRRVVVLAGKGNNGNDGRDAARRLRRRGMRVHVLDAADLPEVLPACDLVIDAAYGTGFRGEWTPPTAPAPVLAVDIPSGVDGLTGQMPGGALTAARTVTFAALKPGLLLRPGADRAGQVDVADIGLDVSGGPGPRRRGRRCGRLAAPPGHRGAQVAGRRAGGGRFAGHDGRRPPDLRRRVPGRGGVRHPVQPRRRPRPHGPDRGRGPPAPGGGVGRGRARRCRRGTVRSPSARAWGPGPRRLPTSGRWWPAGPGPWWSTATA